MERNKAMDILKEAAARILFGHSDGTKRNSAKGSTDVASDNHARAQITLTSKPANNALKVITAIHICPASVGFEST